MSKIGLSKCLLSVTLCMELLSASTSKIEIKAKNINAENGVVFAKNNVIVYYDDMVIKSNSAQYNKITHMLTLDGNIETIGYQGSKEHTNHMEIDTKTKEINFQELFLISENDVWLLADKGKKKDNIYKLGTSVLSSCEISDPLWTMRFSDSLYDKDAKNIKVYNAKVYMWDVPVFYTPYLSFSTNKERSSGLLFPLLGYTETEGFIYEQPIFWAISPSMDIEINPQLRTSRSVGTYGTLRFVDTNHSKGTFRVGYFKDFASYTDEYHLENKSHYGFEFNYDSSEVFKKLLPQGFKDGLYINTTYLNDIDYLTLQKNNLSHFGLSPLQESRVNYFTQNNDYYFGLNAKYFIDTRENVDDDKTLQILPSVQFHKNLSHIFSEKLTYSADLKINNFTRKEGTTLKQAELRIPLSYTTSFLNDFLQLSVEEEIYYSKFFFDNGTFSEDEYSYYSNIHKVKFFTDLVKAYEGSTHVLQPSFTYLKPGNEHQTPTTYEKLTEEQKELFSVGLPEEQLEFGLSQYFYDEKMKLKFFQRLTQKYYIDREYELADLNNEMQYNFEALSLYNIFGYSYEYKKIRFSSSSLSYKASDYKVSLGHSYQKALPDDENAREANDLDFDFSYSYNKKVSFSGGFTYNLDDSSSKQWKFATKYYKDCWSVVASVKQDIKPTSAGAISENTYYLQLNFTPFGSIGTDSLK